jgi:hypothetical protein
VIVAEIDLNHVTRAVRDMNHITRAVIDRGHVTANRDHVTSSLGRAGQTRVAGLRPPTENSSAPSAGRRPRCYYLIDRPSMLSISGRAPSCHLQPISGRTEGVESLSLGRWLIEVMCRLPGFELCIGKEPLPATANLRDLREIRQGED